MFFEHYEPVSGKNKWFTLMQILAPLNATLHSHFAVVCYSVLTQSLYFNQEQ